MNTIDATAVLDYFRQLAERRENLSWRVALQELAQLFHVDEIGLIGADGPLLSHPPTQAPRTSFPWQSDAELFNRIRNSLCALEFPSRSASVAGGVTDDSAGVWLACAVAEPMDVDAQVAWAYRFGPAGFSDEERWTWFFASQALVRRFRRTEQATAPLQRHLEQAAAVTGRLTHDFGNYLTGIMGFTELSLTQAPADGLLHRYLQEVLQSAKHGAAWIHRLHLFCRRGATKCWPTVLPSVAAVEEDRVRSTGAPGLRWESELADNLPLLDIDAGALQTVLQELVDNAREACKGHATIRLSARVCELSATECPDLLGSPEPGTFVEMTVADDGPGITPDDRARLLRDLFFSTKPKHRGLGFLIVYGILQRYHGGFRLAPFAEKGTVVHVYLPVAAGYDGAPPTPRSPQVLLAHSNSLLLESMRKILEVNGCRVTRADSSQATLSAYTARGSSFALVVTDVLLAQQTGCELARRILALDSDANFLFFHTQASCHTSTEEEFFTRFPLLRWPLEPRAFVNAVQAALTHNE